MKCKNCAAPRRPERCDYCGVREYPVPHVRVTENARTLAEVLEQQRQYQQQQQYSQLSAIGALWYRLGVK